MHDAFCNWLIPLDARSSIAWPSPHYDACEAGVIDWLADITKDDVEWLVGRLVIGRFGDAR